MSIRDEWIILDTNIWIFGLRRVPDIPACAEILHMVIHRSDHAMCQCFRAFLRRNGVFRR